MATSTYSPAIKRFASKSKHPFVRDSEKMVEYLLEIDKQIPAKYGWRFTSTDALESQMQKAGLPEVNALYWQDMARNIEAYGVMVVWRAVEVIKVALTSINEGIVLAPAILSRSLLEIAATSLLHANRISRAVDALESVEPGGLVLCKELDELVLKMIHGTRLKESPEGLKQTNIMTTLEKLSKAPGASELLEVYDYLCEVAHPNVIGHARFWAKSEPQGDGSEVIHMAREAHSETGDSIRNHILWSLGWSSVCVRNAFEMNQASVLTIVAFLNTK